MIAIDKAAVAKHGKNLIEIRDVSRDYASSLWLEDGQKLTVKWPAGHESNEVCRYIDPYHFYYGAFCFHIDQFAERLDREHCQVEPEAYLTDLDLYRNFYADRELKDAHGKLIPYKAIIDLDCTRNYGTPSKVIAVCPEAALDRQVVYFDLGNGQDATKAFLSVSQAMSKLLPQLDLPTHEWKLLRAVFQEVEREVPHISQQDFDAIPKDYKGIYEDYDGKHPQWKGRRTAFLPGHGTTLFIEGVSFVIDPKPSLAAQLSAAEARSESSHKDGGQRTEHIR